MELKPCPFCGSEAELQESTEDRFHVQCSKCSISTWAYCDGNGERSVKEWNTRATDPLLKEMAEALEWISEDGHAMASMTIGSRQRLVEVLQKYREQAGCGCGDCLEQR